MNWHCYMFPHSVIWNYLINDMLSLPTEQQREIFVPSKKQNGFVIWGQRLGKQLLVFFLSITLIFYLLTFTDSSRTTSQNVRIVKILIRCCVVLWCLSEHEICVRHISYIEKLGFYHGCMSWWTIRLVVPMPTYTLLCWHYQVWKWQIFGTKA